MHIPAAVNRLIHAIYQGAMEDEPWNSFIDQINSLFNADIVVLLVASSRQQGDKYLLKRAKVAQQDQPELANRWVELDPFQKIAANTPTLIDELDFTQAIEKTAFFSALIKPTRTRHLLAINIPAQGSPDLTLKLRIGRQVSQQNFNDADKQTLAGLTDHIKLALQFHDQMAIMQIERNAFADAINQFMLGTLILDRAGKIVASNRVARDTIDQYDSLTIRSGSLVLADKNSNNQLYKALENIERSDANDNPMPRTITVNLGNSLALGLMVRPVRAEDALSYPVHAHAVVFISDSQGTREISPTTLKDLFGLTGSESKVAAYLANGYTLTEAANALSISVNTAKSHARNVYEKTGVNKQTKFIQLVSNSVARVS